jgi:hypothetical protein
MPVEGVIPFYTKYALETAVKMARYGILYSWLRLFARKLDRDPNAVNYLDAAITPEPVTTQEPASVELNVA